MRILAWLSRNWADTDEGNDPALVPLFLPLPIAVAFQVIDKALTTLPRWQVEQTNEQAATMHATRRTRLFGFVDDLHFRLEQTEQGVRLHARSQSRVGKGDLGQNRRNLLEAFRAIRATTAVG